MSGATLVASALGGWISGALADRIGRVRTLQLTVAFFSVFTFACAFSQDFTQFLVLKTLQGLGFGGEWAAGAVLMAESIRAEHRGLLAMLTTTAQGVPCWWTRPPGSFGLREASLSRG